MTATPITVQPISTEAASATRAAAAARRARSRADGALTVDELSAGESAIRCAMESVGGIWPMMVLAALGAGPSRYGTLKDALTGINDRMLSQTLHRFVRDGLVTRDVVTTRRSCIQYELTDLGTEVRAGVSDLMTTMMVLAPQVVAARERFDHAQTQP